jgi:hypothetical protein
MTPTPRLIARALLERARALPRGAREYLAYPGAAHDLVMTVIAMPLLVLAMVGAMLVGGP